MTQHTIPANQSKIEAAFWRFHREHPEVYRELVRLARKMLAEGHRFGIATIYEVARWNATLAIRPGGTTLKLNNNFRAYYARLMMSNCPDLAGVFRTRELTVPHHEAP